MAKSPVVILLRFGPLSIGLRQKAKGRLKLRIRQEEPDDIWEVEALFDLCFAPGRTALSSYRLRDGVDPVAQLCFVARDEDGILAGAVRHWPVKIAAHKALLLGPIAVHPTRQGEGIAGALIQWALRLCPDLGWGRVILVGDAPFYGAFGFMRLDGVIMPPPTNPDRVLGYGDWDGVTGQVTRDA